MLDLIFDSNKGLGLNIVRYNIGGSNSKNPDKSLRLGGMIPSFINERGEYNWTEDGAQRYVLFQVKQRGANFFEAFSNSPPYFMTISGSPTGNIDGSKDNLKPEFYDQFVVYLVEVVKHYLEKYDLLFQSLDPLNEPISSYWKYGNGQEGCHFDHSTQNTIITKLGELLLDTGLRQKGVSVTASDETSIDLAVSTFKNYTKTALNHIVKVNTHSYNGSQRAALRQLVHSAGKKLWLSEFGTGEYHYSDVQSAIRISKQILIDMKELLATAWVYWQAIEASDYHNQWGLMNAPFSNPGPYNIGKQYYGMAHYSKFMKQGYTILFDNRTDTFIGISKDKNELVIVWTHELSTSSQIVLDLSLFLSKDKTATIMQWRTSATENLKRLKDQKVTGISPIIDIELPPLSMTTFVVKINNGPMIVINNNTVKE
jgi:O-glycosyl hydrolase